MKLPAKCPHRRSAKELSLYDEGAAQCCRIDGCGIAVFVQKQVPLCAGMKHIIEEYRFVWRSSFHGDALVHISRGERNISLTWACCGPQGDGRFWRPIERDLWERLENALLAAGSWAAGPEEEREGIIL